MTTASEERWEFKYVLDPITALAVRSRILPFVRPDPHAGRLGGRYFVRSLYWDSGSLDLYAAHRAGAEVRTKLRMRVYARTAEEAESVKVEMKVKASGRVHKRSAQWSVEKARTFLRAGSGRDEGAVLDDFVRQVRAGRLRPLILVDYRREAYFARQGPTCRFTFDTDLRAAAGRELFPARDPGLSVARETVFEVKTPGGIPEWLRVAVRDQGLTPRSNSKYVSAIEAVYGGRPYRAS